MCRVGLLLYCALLTRYVGSPHVRRTIATPRYANISSLHHGNQLFAALRFVRPYGREHFTIQDKGRGHQEEHRGRRYVQRHPIGLKQQVSTEAFVSALRLVLDVQ